MGAPRERLERLQLTGQIHRRDLRRKVVARDEQPDAIIVGRPGERLDGKCAQLMSVPRGKDASSSAASDFKDAELNSVHLGLPPIGGSRLLEELNRYRNPAPIAGKFSTHVRRYRRRIGTVCREPAHVARGDFSELEGTL